MKKGIINSSIIAVISILFCFGSFLILGAAHGYVFGSKYALFFGNQIALFGGCMIFGGLIAVMHLFELRKGKRKWTIALGIALLYIGSFFLYFGLSAYFFPRFPADIDNGALGITAGSVYEILGIILVLVDIVFQKRNARTRESPAG